MHIDKVERAILNSTNTCTTNNTLHALELSNPSVYHYPLVPAKGKILWLATSKDPNKKQKQRQISTKVKCIKDKNRTKLPKNQDTTTPLVYPALGADAQDLIPQARW